MGMVAYWIVIMCSMSCAISKSQVSPSVRKSHEVRDLGDNCTNRLCSVDQFLELAPCPPPQKTHLLCDIPVSLTCRERTKILRKCIYYNELKNTAILRVFESCNQSFMVQCDEFFSLCKSETNFKCGTPRSTIPPPSVRPPIFSTTERTTIVSTHNVSDSAMNDSELEVNGGRPEHPFDNAGAENDRNWLPLLSLLAIPILAVVVCIVYSARKRQRKKSNGSHGNGSVHEESNKSLTEMEMTDTSKRKSILGQGDLFKNVPYIDAVDDTTKMITEEEY